MRAPRSVDVEQIASTALAAIPIAALGAADGGFYSRPWGWATVGLAVALVAAAAVRASLDVSRNALLLLAALAVFTAWSAISLLWTRSAGATALELERLVLYVVAVAAAALVVRRRTSPALVAGVYAGTSTLTIWGLAGYLLMRDGAPDPLQGWYLHRPIGYANGMAITAAIAILLALGLTTTTRSRVTRALAAGSLVPLAAALALTGSRAAWAALLVGALVWTAAADDRARLLPIGRLLVFPTLAAVLVAASDVRNTALVGAEADRLGELLLLAILALTTLAASAGWTRVASTARRRLPLRAVTGLIVIGAAGMAIHIAANPQLLTGDRAMYWQIAADELGERPLLGAGAGSFGQVWLEKRPEPIAVKDAHSLLLETAAELGVVGLALVGVLLALPLAWGVRARRTPHAPAVTAAFAAFAAHAAVDWDWELPSVTLAALFCAVAVGVSAEDGDGVDLAPWQRGAVLALGTGALMLGLAGFVGSSALEDANRALASGDHAAAKQAAARAERWQPWTVEPTLIKGRSLLALGDRDAARASFIRAAAREPNDYRAWLALASVSDGETVAAALERARALNRFAVARP